LANDSIYRLASWAKLRYSDLLSGLKKVKKHRDINTYGN